VVAVAGAGAVSAREDILARIRAARGDLRPPEIPRDHRTAGEQPPGSAALLDLLQDRLIDYKATVARTPRAGLEVAVRDALAAILPAGGRVIVPAGLPFPVGQSTVDDGTAGPRDLDGYAAVVTMCAAAAAETGTIALDAGAGQGRRAISLVPDRHVCVVRAEQVVQTVPELVARLDPARGPITLISGPSATSDIELQRVEGVHGPRTLVVILVT
jgi:L-lactate dehydrogenase complex protein LldG